MTSCQKMNSKTSLNEENERENPKRKLKPTYWREFTEKNWREFTEKKPNL